VVLLSINQITRKEEDMTICRIYKENHPSTPKKVVNVFDLGYLPWRRKGFPRTAIIHTYNRNKRNLELSQ
jgi:hypothetical protein